MSFEQLVLEDVEIRAPGLSRRQACLWLAERLGVTLAAVQHWFAGRRDVSVDVIDELAKVFSWDDTRRGTAARLAALCVESSLSKTNTDRAQIAALGADDAALAS